MEKDNYRVIKAMEMIKKAGLEGDEKILKMALALASDSKDDAELFTALQERITPSVVYNTVFPNEFKDPGNQINGPISVTKNFGTSLHEIGQGGILSLGQSGVGKTTWSYKAIIETDKQGGKFWVFDTKRDYNGLINYIPEIYFFSPYEFKRNFLEFPKGVKPDVWRNVFAGYLCREEGILVASKNFLLEALDTTYRNYGSYEGGSLPCIHDLKETIYNTNCFRYSVTADYKNRLINRLTGLIVTLGEYLKCSVGYDLIPLMSKNVVWQISGIIDETYQRLFILDLISYVYHYRMANNIRGIY